MPSDKEILYQILSREVDNILSNFGPIVNVMSGQIKNYLFGLIDPYVDAFLSSSNKNELNTKAVGAFAKEQVDSKVNDFLRKFEEAKKNEGPEDFIV